MKLLWIRLCGLYFCTIPVCVCVCVCEIESVCVHDRICVWMIEFVRV